MFLRTYFVHIEIIQIPHKCDIVQIITLNKIKREEKYLPCYILDLASSTDHWCFFSKEMSKMIVNFNMAVFSFFPLL